MAGDQNVWDAHANVVNVDAFDHLSRMVSGNDQLVAEPGLVQALLENNATPQQAGAVNQFLVGLKAEQKVQNATGKIQLSQSEQGALDAMGVNYRPVLYTPQDAKTALTQQMAAKGYQPVLDDKGQVKTDAEGNPLAEKIPQKHSGGGWTSSVGSFFSHVGHAVAVPFKYVGKEASALYHGDLYPGQQHLPGQSNAFTPEKLSKDLTEATTFLQAAGRDTNPAAPGYFDDQAINNATASKLGYDPGSFFSMAAFEAHGYARHDTSDLSEKYGNDAVVDAGVYAADPKKFVDQIVSDTSLSPEQAAAKIAGVSSDDFQNLVKQVNARKNDVGSTLASDIGIDPVKHSALFTAVSTSANLAAMIAMDPLNIGLTAYSAGLRTSAAIKDLTDAGGVARVFDRTVSTGTGARRSQGALQDMVDHSNQLREAITAGENSRAAALSAKIQANPFGGLAGDFLGEDQILGIRSGYEGLSGEEATKLIGKGDLPFVTGKAEALDTYDKAVNYLASKSALLRLTGGHAPVEASVMPGALSSRFYRDIKGTLQSWSAGRSTTVAVQDASRFIDSALADPGKLEFALNERLLTHAMPSEADAIDVLTGKVLSAEQKLTEARAAQAAAEHAAEQSDPRIAKLFAKAKGTNFAPEADAFRAKADTLINKGEDVQDARTAASSAESGLASAKRAREQAAIESDLADNLVITDSGRGFLRGNRLRYGLAEAPESKVGKALSIYTLGTARRAGLLAARFTNWLPRNTYIDITQDGSGDVVRKMARTYMTSGDSNMLALRWAMGDLETRKTIVQGLKDQIGHAAGLSRTKAGQEMMAKWKVNAENENYLAFGDGFKDANGVHAGMYPGQIQTRFSLPSFGAIHKAAAKIGVFEGTMGRLMGTTPVERLMIQWKLGALFTPVTAMRANLESWLNAHAEGLFLRGARAKAVLRDAGRLDYAEVSRSAPIDKILSFAPLQAAGRAYRSVLMRGMSEDEARAILEMPEDLLHAYIHEQAAFHYAMNMDPGGVSEITAAAAAGFKAGKVRYKDGQVLGEGVHRVGYEVTDEIDGANGANLYAHNLALRINKAPNVAKALIERLRDPELEADHVVAALESGAAKAIMKDSMFGKTYLTSSGKQVRAVTDAEKTLGKQQWADKLTEDFRHVVTGRNGQVQEKLLKYVDTHGKAPDADWILKNITKQNRPETLLKPIIQAVPGKAGVGGLVQEILDKEGRGYQWMVERLIQRHSTSPLFAASYAKSKVGLEDFKQGLIAQGFSKEAAERTVSSIAAHQGWERVARMLDDPHMKSQMDVVGRSFFAFSRATTMMLRRWGGTFWRNPQQARRYMLAGEAAIHSGLVYKDETTGQWMFHFPASGVAQEVLLHAMNTVPGFRGAFLFPTSDFTGRVGSIIPGSGNPLQYQTNPMVSLTGRSLASLVPTHRELFDMIDRKLNGSSGQGQGFFATLTPNLYKKVADTGLLPGGSDAVVSSATVGSLYNLYAAGMVPDANASPTEVDDFMGRLQTGIKNQLFLRAVLGAFSPASITTPDNENDSSKADKAYALIGAQGLRDEYKMILNQTDGDVARATAIWTALHPDKTVFTESGSQATASRAVMPATQVALNWMNDNHSFLQKYKSVGAYFLPEKSAKDPYSQAAYRAQLEEGLRERKTPRAFLEDAYVASAAAVYYPMYDKYQADLAQAKASGNEQLAAQHRQDWAVWSNNFKETHQTFKAHTEASAENIAKAQGQFADLKSMIHNKDVPGGMATALRGMVVAYDNYQSFTRLHPGTTNADSAAKASARSMLQDYLSSVITAQPELTDLYNGVFRPLSGYNLEATE